MSETNSKHSSLEISVQNDYIGNPVPAEIQDDEMEEGEASEDEVEVNIVIGNAKTNHMSNSLSRSKPFGDFDDGIEAVSDAAIDDKLTERTNRFGEVSKPNYLPKESLQSLYKSLNLCKDDFNRGGWRSEALLVKGIAKQTKEDIKNYFSDFKPKYLEWLNKDECNVVFENSAAPALYSLSCPIEEKIKPQETTITIKIDNSKKQTGKSKVSKESAKSDSSDSTSSDSDGSSDSDSDESSSSDSDDDSSSGSDSNSSSSEDSSSTGEEMEEGETYGPETPPQQDQTMKPVENTAAVSDIGVDVPTGGRWRLGVPFPGAKAVFMRFAHCKDSRVLGLKNAIEIFDSQAKGKSTVFKETPRWREERVTKDPKVFSRLGRMSDLEMPPREPLMMPVTQPQFYEDPKNYKDLDDPIDGTKNPWGFLAQNWTSKETQNSLDYQALLRDHVSNKSDNRKRTLQEYEVEEMRPTKQMRTSAMGAQRHYTQSYNYSEESDASDDVVEWNSKVKIPRMKMYADDEEKKQLKRRVIKPSHRRPHFGRRPSHREAPEQRNRFDLRQLLTRKRH